jgi:hypothetical protein
MGPLEHSILFGAVSAWFGVLALSVFSSNVFGKCVAAVAMIGVLVSQARGPLAAYMIALGLAVFYSATQQFTARWKVLGALVALYIGVVFSYSQSPIATLLRFGGVSPEAGWYRQVIWATASPLVLGSPLFGLGLQPQWDWQDTDLVGESVDSLWLATAMQFGIPGSVLMFLTMVGAVWRGPVDKSLYLTREERRLSVALGLVIATVVFLGFTVHFWGICAILIGVFPGIRAYLAEVAIVRGGAVRSEFSRP